jgi:hypothetical protein
VALLRSTPDEREVIAQRTSEWLSGRGMRVPVDFIEKDFWVTEALRSLAQPLTYEADGSWVEARVVFKGGTSLSKAYGLIERFSEDIDLFVQVDVTSKAGVTKGAGAGRRDTAFKKLAERVANDVALRVDPQPGKFPKSGYLRSFEAPYTTASDEGDLLPHVLIELTHMGSPTPNAPHQLRSLMADYAAYEGISPKEYAEFEPLTIDVLMPHRTLIEKLCALQAACAEVVAKPESLTRMARHFYDVHALVNAKSVRDSLEAQDGLAAEMAEGHVTEAKKAKRVTGPRPSGGFGESLWITDQEVQSAARIAYDEQVHLLVYGRTPSFDEVLTSVIEHAAIL